MAITLGDAVLFLKGNTEGLDKTLDEAAAKTRNWASGLGGQLQTLAGGAILGGVAVVTGAVVGIGSAALGVATDVNNATNGIKTALGSTQEEAERLASVAKDVWGNNFAGSVEEAGLAVANVQQILGDMPDDALQGATEDAFRLKDAFGLEVGESLDAAKTLMDNFGMSSGEAMDFLAAGMQKGLNRSGDFLDTIGEYSVQMKAGGASAGEFFSLMENGLEGGMLGTDKAADAFKEFRVRIQDGSKLTSESLEAIGIDADDMSAALASGQMTAAEAFGIVQAALNETDDSTVRMQAGVGLLGTQFEDLGDSALSLSMVGTRLEDLAGSTDTLNAQYDNWPAMWEGMKRGALVALAPLGDKLLELGNNIVPVVQQGFNWLGERLPGWIQYAVDSITTFQQALSGDWVDSSLVSPFHRVIGVLGQVIAAFQEGGLQGVLDTLMPYLQTAFANLVAWIQGQAGVLLASFVTWKDAFLAWIVPATAEFLVQWPGMLNSFLDWIGTAAGPLLLKLGDWALAFVGWIIPMIPDFLIAIGGILAALLIWLVETSAVINTRLVEDWIPAFLGWIATELIPGLWIALQGAEDKIMEWIRGAANAVFGKAGEIGSNLIDGISNGIKNAAGGLISAARNAAQGAADAITDFFSIQSPSKWGEDKGAFIDEGLARGIGGGQAIDAARGLSQSVAGAIGSPTPLGSGGLGGGGGRGPVTIQQNFNAPVTIANGDDKATFFGQVADVAVRAWLAAENAGTRQEGGI